MLVIVKPVPKLLELVTSPSPAVLMSTTELVLEAVKSSLNSVLSVRDTAMAITEEGSLALICISIGAEFCGAGSTPRLSTLNQI